MNLLDGFYYAIHDMIGQRSKRERFAIPNRLVHEDSPSLRQHAGDPVDWWPWCDKAFKKALAENRPLFLSVGHSGCHWCHVMEREVFENETIAAYLNDLFVGIKVDREERPDIDKHCQNVYRLFNQRPGAWPIDKILNFMRENRGVKFDPLPIDLFFENIDRFLQIHKTYRER